MVNHTVTKNGKEAILRVREGIGGSRREFFFFLLANAGLSQLPVSGSSVARVPGAQYMHCDMMMMMMMMTMMTESP